MGHTRQLAENADLTSNARMAIYLITDFCR